MARDGLWGKGTYFAEAASYSDWFAHTTSSGTKQLILAEVIIGKPDKRIRSRAIKKPSEGFDSVEACDRGFEFKIVYEDCKMYPKYCIEYK